METINEIRESYSIRFTEKAQQLEGLYFRDDARGGDYTGEFDERKIFNELKHVEEFVTWIVDPAVRHDAKGRPYPRRALCKRDELEIVKVTENITYTVEVHGKPTLELVK